MKGPDADAELGGSAAALKKLGGAYGDTRAFTLPDGSERRLVVCKKISQTPTAYPATAEKLQKSLFNLTKLRVLPRIAANEFSF